MADREMNAGETKLLQYLNEAYAKEKELEVALEAHISMTTRPPYKKRLQEHLKETKAHARGVEKRIKKISGSGPAALEKIGGQVAGQLKSAAKGPLHMLRGTGEAEKMLKNAKTEYWNEHEEIATYTAIEVLATEIGDRETAKLAKTIRREEEKMAGFIERQIPALTKAVAREEIPAAERNKSSRSSGRRRSTSKASSSRRSAAKPASSRASSKSKAKKPAAKRAASSATTRSKSRAKSGSTRAKSGSSRSSSRSKSARKS